jgi:hypothetical protein
VSVTRLCYHRATLCLFLIALLLYLLLYERVRLSSVEVWAGDWVMRNSGSLVALPLPLFLLDSVRLDGVRFDGAIACHQN